MAIAARAATVSRAAGAAQFEASTGGVLRHAARHFVRGFDDMFPVEIIASRTACEFPIGRFSPGDTEKSAFGNIRLGEAYAFTCSPR